MRNAILLISVVLLCHCGRQQEIKPEEKVAKPAEPKASTLAPELLDRIIVPFNRGVALMDQFKPTKAVVAFEEVVGLAPEWVLGRLNFGIALLNSEENRSRAEAELKWVIARERDNPYGHYAYAMLLRHQTRFEEAVVQFEEVLRIDPEDADAHYQLGVLYQEQDPAAAQAHLEKTLEKIPHHESACYSLAMMLRRNGEPERSRAMLKRFQVLRKMKAGQSSGMKYGEMGRYARVIRMFPTPRPETESHGLPDYQDIAAKIGLTQVATGSGGLPGEDTGFGPGIAAADTRGQGGMSLFLTGMAQGGTLYEDGAGSFALNKGSGIDGPGVIGAWFGDYDGDGDPDLYLTRKGPNRLYRNDGQGSFIDVTKSSGTAGGSELSLGAVWTDADHDGDLDLYVANYAKGDQQGAANALWRNNGDGSFSDQAAKEGIDGGQAATVAVLTFDFDDDRDLDLYLINDGSANQLFLNDRVGNYTDATSWFPNLADTGPGLGAVLADLDGNGHEDLLLLRGTQPPRLFLCSGPAAFVEDPRFGAAMAKLGGVAGGLAADLDLDGDLDLVFLDAGKEDFGHQVLLNCGGGNFDEALPLGERSDQPRARGALALDLDGDGSLELVVTRSGAAPQVWQAAAPKDRHWLTVLPDQSGDDEKLWLDPTATGLRVEIKSGSHLQVASLGSSSGYLSSPPRRAHFGLGSHGSADYVRLSWTDGVFQSELEVAADQHWRIGKMVRKPSSCPILFSWDGQRFAYVTDFLGVGGIGFFSAPGSYSPPDPSEHVRIPPAQIQPKNGQYLLRIAEPLEEITYLDKVRLIAYDHPANWEIYPDERFSAREPMPSGRPYAVEEKTFPQAARDERGLDVLEKVLAVDRDYVDLPKDPRFMGYAQDHWLELDFGNRLEGLDREAPLVLYLHGWVEYTFSHVNYAAWQAGISLKGPAIEVPDDKGGWRVAMADAGFPAGLPRMMTLDVSDLPLRRDGRLRLRTNMEIFWDQAFIAVDTSKNRVRKHILAPVSARLGYLGYPREYSPDGKNPTLYDYHRVDRGVPFKNMSGDFTRYGDVRELLDEVDDRFVIMARGEEVQLVFDQSSLPPLAQGWTRTLVLYSDGYCKDMDLYTAFPDTVEPLPYHGMSNYPPTRPSPNHAELARETRKWNTRRIEGNQK